MSQKSILPDAPKVLIQPDQAPSGVSGPSLLCQFSYTAFLAQAKYPLCPDPSHEPYQAISGNLDFCDRRSLNTTPLRLLVFSLSNASHSVHCSLLLEDTGHDSPNGQGEFKFTQFLHFVPLELLPQYFLEWSLLVCNDIVEIRSLILLIFFLTGTSDRKNKSALPMDF